jgi:hypothetical protein
MSPRSPAVFKFQESPINGATSRRRHHTFNLADVRLFPETIEPRTDYSFALPILWAKTN